MVPGAAGYMRCAFREGGASGAIFGGYEGHHGTFLNFSVASTPEIMPSLDVR